MGIEPVRLAVVRRKSGQRGSASLPIWVGRTCRSATDLHAGR